jgi:hypothetical protein
MIRWLASIGIRHFLLIPSPLTVDAHMQARRTRRKDPDPADWPPWCAVLTDKDQDNDKDPRLACVSECRNAQRNVHSTSPCDGMVVLCVWKYNKGHTKGLAQNNPDIDVWRTIHGTMSMRMLRAKLDVGEVLSEYLAFDLNTLGEIHFVSEETCPFNWRHCKFIYSPFQTFLIAWALDLWGYHRNHC